MGEALVVSSYIVNRVASLAAIPILARPQLSAPSSGREWAMRGWPEPARINRHVGLGSSRGIGSRHPNSTHQITLIIVAEIVSHIRKAYKMASERCRVDARSRPISPQAALRVEV